MVLCFFCGKPLPIEERVAITGHAAPNRPGAHPDPTIRLHPPCAIRLAAELLRLQDRETAPAAPAAKSPPYETMALTPREGHVLEGMVAGQTNREIGIALGLAEKTVKNIVTEVLGKLGVVSRTEAAVLAVRSGLVQQAGS